MAEAKPPPNPYRERFPLESEQDLNWRMHNDPAWAALVTQLEHFYSTGQFTPSDVRTAAVYAMTRVEMRRPASFRLCAKCRELIDSAGRCACNEGR